MSESDSISTIIPNHVAIIMDGNRRWAKRYGKSTEFGHKEGYLQFKKIVDYGFSLGIKYITVYAFSTENWKRSKEEVNGIMSLARFVANNEIKKYAGTKVRIRILGSRSDLPDDIAKKIAEVEFDTANNKDYNLNIAFSYGGRAEIINAVKSVLEEKKDLNEENVSKKMYTFGQPDPDLIIRPSGEERLSNFMLWQSAYSEFVFMDVLWPDFTPQHLNEALWEYAGRDRRFGGIK